MASPFLHKMLCGSFSESVTRQFSLDDIDHKIFEEVLNLWCGIEDCNEKDLRDVLTMASLADRLRMAEVVAALEDSILGELGTDVCAEVLISSQRLGLRRVEEAAWEMAVGQFEEVSKTAMFTYLDEETVGRLLEEDGLGVMKEEEAFEGLVRWMKGGGGGALRGRELLRMIRFGVMEQKFLESKAHDALPEGYAGWIDDLVLEVVRARAAVREKAPLKLRLLDAKALTRRRGMGVEWERYSGGGEGRRLEGRAAVNSLAACGGRMCGGCGDGSIRVWTIATLEEERAMEGGGDEVYALAARDGVVISGHVSGAIRAWDAGSGRLRRELGGRADCVFALCACGPRLASGSTSRSIRVWALGPGPDWPRETTLRGHAGSVHALAGWEGRLVSGSCDGTVRVWDLGAGGLDATLRGHTRTVHALAAVGRRLFSASGDGAVRAWAVGTWEAVASVVGPHGAGGSGWATRCLAADGPKLVGGFEFC